MTKQDCLNVCGEALRNAVAMEESEIPEIKTVGTNIRKHVILATEAFASGQDAAYIEAILRTGGLLQDAS